MKVNDNFLSDISKFQFLEIFNVSCKGYGHDKRWNLGSFSYEIQTIIVWKNVQIHKVNGLDMDF